MYETGAPAYLLERQVALCRRVSFISSKNDQERPTSLSLFSQNVCVCGTQDAIHKSRPPQLLVRLPRGRGVEEGEKKDKKETARHRRRDREATRRDKRGESRQRKRRTVRVSGRGREEERTIKEGRDGKRDGGRGQTKQTKEARND